MIRALDLFCKAGGAALGILSAKFKDIVFDEVVGIDIENYSHIYPSTFIQSDVNGLSRRWIESFDFVWASPPCQAYSGMLSQEEKKKKPDLIDFTRFLIENVKLSCIENIPSAPLRRNLRLAGPMVGLNRIKRLRHFEISWKIHQPAMQYPSRQDWIDGKCIVVAGSLGAKEHFYPRKKIGLKGNVSPKEACEAMGISLPMNREEVVNAVAPPMAEYIAIDALKQIYKRRT